MITQSLGMEMHSLDQILEENIALSDDEKRLAHALRCSPFIKRLIEGDNSLLADLLQDLHTPWTAPAMQD